LHVNAVRERLKFSLKRVENALTESPWLTGSTYSIADIDAYSLISPLPDLAPEVVNERDTPRIADFLRRVRDRKAVKEALAFSRSGRPHEAFVPGAEPSRWG
jgi:glutathione S-transferase